MAPPGFDLEAEVDNRAYLDNIDAREEEKRRAVRVVLEEKQLEAEFSASQRTERTKRHELVEREFRAFLRAGRNGVTSPNVRAMSMAADGGYLVPGSFSDVFQETWKTYDRLYDASGLFETDRGSACGYPVDDDAAAVATVVAENAASITTSPVTFSNIAFPVVPSWRSGHIVGSMDLAADSAFPLEQVLAKMFAKRFARGCGAQFITNLLADADTAVTTAAPTAVTPDECFDLLTAVDSSYSQNGAYLMNASVYSAVVKTKATAGGMYLHPPAVDPEGYPVLHGKRVYLCPSMASIAANAKAVAFGDLSMFVRRQVRDSLKIKTYFERYAPAGQLGWEAFLRIDGKLVKGTTAAPMPIRLLVCHA